MRILKFEMRDEVKDVITGFKGVVIARTEWSNGCVRYTLMPKALKDGIPQDSVTIDEEQLVLVSKAKKKEVAPSGGERQNFTLNHMNPKKQ